MLFAETGAEACDLVLEICRRHGVKKAIKSKSMLSEEAGLNEALAAAGVEPVETDLGEYIIQLAGEPPSHIIAPAVHKSKDEVADLFAVHHRQPRKTDIGEMTREARAVLRGHFVSADLGISGGNFLIAETGSGLVVTNEGNGRMVTTLPRVHVCITGIEKVIPTLEDFAALLRLLTRSATGQPISNYVSVFTGPRREGDRDGPEHMYFILVDAGRTNLVGGDMQEMLRCIRCGACMNHCPVYKTVGGHAYGWVYPGPMGAVLTPSYVGLENALDLPHAATLCNQCGVVCPVQHPPARAPAQAAREAGRTAFATEDRDAGVARVGVDGATSEAVRDRDALGCAVPARPRRQRAAHPPAAGRVRLDPPARLSCAARRGDIPRSLPEDPGLRLDFEFRRARLEGARVRPH